MDRGCTLDAIKIFEQSRTAAKNASDAGVCFYAPGKAANCGGVAVSGLEMAQNSQRVSLVMANICVDADRSINSSSGLTRRLTPSSRPS